MKALKSPAERAKFAADALNFGGAAFFEKPDPKSPAGPLLSRYILEFLAVHLKWIKGSVVHRRRPFGALALTYVAVQRSFESWKKGTDAGMPVWEGDAIGKLLLSARHNNIDGLERHLDRFDKILAGAMAVQQSRPGRKREVLTSATHDRALQLFPPSSEPEDADHDDSDEEGGSYAHGSSEEDQYLVIDQERHGKVNEYMLPGCLWWVIGMEWGSNTIMSNLSMLAGLASFDIFPDIVSDGRPPVVARDEVMGLVSSWITDKRAIMMGLDEVCTESFVSWDIESVLPGDHSVCVF
ncbi:hypothetical protein OF83DRAFT_1288080 [Amylostereum chailletii]|nr:hypothetical protein OF83DRAFT_1288080 [Amylostereum chailletii]